jgi:beta-lactamase superfamily II metal-dependent hydrolase
MGYQIDFLPIGNGACGDSVALRFGDLDSEDPSEQTVVLIDGGFTDDANKISEHFEQWYGHKKIDLVISTHPDQDHINGLKGVVEKMDVGELWMHLQWLHQDVFLESLQSDFHNERLTERLVKALQSSASLAELASQKVPVIKEPFAGETVLETAHGTIRTVGPSRDYYESLLPQFLDWKPKTSSQVTAVEKIILKLQKAAETFDIETLRDSGETSPQNNSSALTLIEYGDNKFLFPGDAGRDGLDLACEELEYLGNEAGSLTLVQVPHHGSRRNVGPTVLNRLLGSKLSSDGQQRGHGYVSAAQLCDDHPKKVVLNAFRRRGYPVVSTEGVSRMLSLGGPDRGWTQSIPHPFYTEVEGDES